MEETAPSKERCSEASQTHAREMQQRFEELALLTRQLEAQGEALEETKKKLAQSAQRNKRLTAELAACVKSRQSLLNSLSWRITTPLRAVSGLLRRR
ncbi:MAG: hypothetical protein ACSHWZ_18125 [Sulfitobacter sp.]